MLSILPFKVVLKYIMYSKFTSKNSKNYALDICLFTYSRKYIQNQTTYKQNP